jgi:hypothetical protein
VMFRGLVVRVFHSVFSLLAEQIRHAQQRPQ